MKKSAFTLVELLVVIAIIFLLISILLAALRGARERAKVVICTNNLHQLGRAIHQYAKDYDDWLPGWWHSITANGNQNGDNRTGTLYPYHKQRKLYWCGNDKRGYAKKPYSYTWAGMCQVWDGSKSWAHGGWNTRTPPTLVGGRGEMLGRFKRPSEALMMVEENTNENEWPAINDALCCNYDRTGDRHMRVKCVVVYVDGHTGILKPFIEYNENDDPDRNQVFGIH